jgi:hypothetical protein
MAALYRDPSARMLMEALDMNLAEEEMIAYSLCSHHTAVLAFWARYGDVEANQDA